MAIGRPANRVSFGIEYLRQHFEPGFVFDDGDNEISDGFLAADSFSFIF